MESLGYVTAFALIGLMIGTWLLRRAVPEERYKNDTRLLLLVIGVTVAAIVAGIVVGTLLQ